MIIARNANVNIQNTIDFRLAFLALSAAYQVHGPTPPPEKKLATTAGFKQIKKQ